MKMCQQVLSAMATPLHHTLVGLVCLLSIVISAGASAEETITYYHHDALGSSVAATNEYGNVLWREAYRPFGERIRDEDGNTNTVWYTGKQHEDEIGLTYFGARWYDPVVGRFMSVDPAEIDPQDRGLFNRYSYAKNSPYGYVDPDGRVPLLIPVVLMVGKELAGVAFEEATGLPAVFSVKGAATAAGRGIAKAGGRGAREGGQQAGSGVAKEGDQVFERIVSNAELNATQQSGLLRGGREGENFFTNSASLDAKRAQQRLGLDGPLRDARIRFRIKNNVEVTGPRSAAPGQTGTAGGGREFSTNGRTEIEILRVDRLRK